MSSHVSVHTEPKDLVGTSQRRCWPLMPVVLRLWGRSHTYLLGIRPFGEARAELVMNELRVPNSDRFRRYRAWVAYPELPLQKCDLCIGEPGDWLWAVEVKLLRLRTTAR